MFCPDCGVPLGVENGLWYCPEEDAYKGEVEEDEED